MSNQVVIIGGKEIPIVNPKRDLTIASRQSGGKYHVPSAAPAFGDGVNWASISHNFAVASVQATSIIDHDGKLKLFGYDSYQSESTDGGDTWTFTPTGRPVTLDFVDVVQFEGGVAGQLVGTYVTGANVTSETGGATWSPRTPAKAGASRRFVRNANALLIVGDYSGSSFSAVHRSTTGRSWSTLTSSSGLGNQTYYGGCEGYNGRMLVCGANGVISYSDNDGLNWTPVTSGFGTSRVNALVRCDALNAIIAIGGNGKAGISTDNGLTWNSYVGPFNAAVNMHTLAEGNGLVIAGGDQGQIYTTTDGLNWTKQNAHPFGSATISRIQQLRGRFFAMATNGLMAVNG